MPILDLGFRVIWYGISVASLRSCRVEFIQPWFHWRFWDMKICYVSRCAFQAQPKTPSVVQLILSRLNIDLAFLLKWLFLPSHIMYTQDIYLEWKNVNMQIYLDAARQNKKAFVLDRSPQLSSSIIPFPYLPIGLGPPTGLLHFSIATSIAVWLIKALSEA